MKKLSFIIPVIIVSLTFFSCFPSGEKKKEEVTTTAPTTETTVKGAIEVETVGAFEEKDLTEVERNVLLPLPSEATEFVFCSGAGAWSTSLILNSDGSFSGEYHDSEMGNMGEEYPNGTVYVCSFRGCFENITKINEYSYKMTISDVETNQKPGKEWIEDGFKYIASEPYGINDGEEFIFYLPETPLDGLDEEFLTWWPGRYYNDGDYYGTLDYYGILNVNTGCGFFS